MNCQKCRTPLRLDSSLQDLNPAALNLLAGSAGHSIYQSTRASRIPYPQERKDLYNRTSKDAGSPVFNRTIPAVRQGLGTQPAVAAATKTGLSKDNPGMSFVMLTDSQVVPPQQTPEDHEVSQSKHTMRGLKSALPEASTDPKEALSHQIESTTRLFEILSSRSDIDHPICTECTELLLNSLQSRLGASTKERDAYVMFLKTLKSSAPTSFELAKAQKSLASSKEAESKAFTELLSLEKEKAGLDDEIASLEAESLALDDEERAFWRSRNAFALTLSSFQNDRDALNAAYDHDVQQLERLQRTNVYNDTFCIGHDGFFGTINGLRLGRLPPPQNVDWSEINAAWGNAALLLATVADKLGFTFRNYRIKPMGSTSKIERIEHPSPQHSIASHTQTTAGTPQQQQFKITSLDLFSSGDLPLGRGILHRRLDAGMVAFLDCLRQLGEFVETGRIDSPPPHPGSPSSGGSKDPPGGGGGLKLPYGIKKDKIGDASIKLGVSQDEAWTRACKYALTCCKFLLAHASNVIGPEKTERRG